MLARTTAAETHSEQRRLVHPHRILARRPAGTGQGGADSWAKVQSHQGRSAKGTSPGAHPASRLCLSSKSPQINERRDLQEVLLRALEIGAAPKVQWP
jgi:hypothetical protein